MYEHRVKRTCKMKFIIICVLVLSVISCFVDGDCGVFSKQEWGGLRPVHVEYLPRPVSLVIIMHTVTPPCSSNEGCADIVRSIQTQHMDVLKFWDIGASFLIGGNGKVFEGAGWLHVGAHTYGYNRKSIGVSFIGNFNVNEPTQEAIAAARNLIKCGVERGHLAPGYHVVAHKQLIATESPGRKLYSAMRHWPDWLENVDGIKNMR